MREGIEYVDEAPKQQASNPVLIAYMMEFVPQQGQRQGFWAKTRVGAAFGNDDGSYWVELSAIPRSGKLLLRKALPKRTEGKAEVQP
jgi:hypothetical protein